MADLSIRCQTCGKVFQAKLARRRFCGDPCRWEAWKRQKEEAGRAPLERTLQRVAGLLEEAVQEIREALGEGNVGTWRWRSASGPFASSWTRP